MDTIQPISNICNSPSVSASGTFSRDQACGAGAVQIQHHRCPPQPQMRLASTFFSARHISGCRLQELAQNLGSAPWSGAGTNAWMGIPESICLQLLLLAFRPPSFPSSRFFLPSLFWQHLLLQKCRCPACAGDSLANSAQITRDTPSRSGKSTPSICKQSAWP